MALLVVTLTEEQLETLRTLVQFSIDNDSEEAGKLSHREDRASYYRALADQHSIMAAIESAEECEE